MWNIFHASNDGHLFCWAAVQNGSTANAKCCGKMCFVCFVSAQMWQRELKRMSEAKNKPKHCMNEWMNEWNNENEKICRHKLNFLFDSLIWLFSFMCNVISLRDACFTLLSLYWLKDSCKKSSAIFFSWLVVVHIYTFLHYPHTMQIRVHIQFSL